MNIVYPENPPPLSQAQTLSVPFAEFTLLRNYLIGFRAANPSLISLNSAAPHLGIFVATLQSILTNPDHAMNTKIFNRCINFINNRIAAQQALQQALQQAPQQPGPQQAPQQPGPQQALQQAPQQAPQQPGPQQAPQLVDEQLTNDLLDTIERYYIRCTSLETTLALCREFIGKIGDQGNAILFQITNIQD